MIQRHVGLHRSKSSSNITHHKGVETRPCTRRAGGHCSLLDVAISVAGAYQQLQPHQDQAADRRYGSSSLRAPAVVLGGASLL